MRIGIRRLCGEGDIGVRCGGLEVLWSVVVHFILIEDGADLINLK